MLYRNYLDGLLADKNRWAYYSGLEKYTLDKLRHNPKRFIKDYLGRGSKLPPNVERIISLYLTEVRAYHTVSIFLLGIVVYENVKSLRESIDKYLEKFKKEYSELCFSYFWFQICFYHDIWSDLEKNTDLDTMKILETIFADAKVPNISDVIHEMNQHSKVIPPEIRSCWHNYLKMREKKKNIWHDHGFAGGALYFYFRKLGFEDIRKRQDVIKVNHDRFYDRNTELYWSQELLDTAHQDIAWCIVAHNIWYIQEHDQNYQEYLDNSLEELIITQPIFEVVQYPLYYMLLLIDTFDVFKMSYHNLSVDACDCFNTLLDNIQIQENDNKIGIIFIDKLEMLKTIASDRIEENAYWIPELKEVICFD
jgi:hypothetical protein